MSRFSVSVLFLLGTAAAFCLQDVTGIEVDGDLLPNQEGGQYSPIERRQSFDRNPFSPSLGSPSLGSPLDSSLTNLIKFPFNSANYVLKNVISPPIVSRQIRATKTNAGKNSSKGKKTASSDEKSDSPSKSFNFDDLNSGISSGVEFSLELIKHLKNFTHSLGKWFSFPVSLSGSLLQQNIDVVDYITNIVDKNSGFDLPDSISDGTTSLFRIPLELTKDSTNFINYVLKQFTELIKYPLTLSSNLLTNTEVHKKNQ